MTAAAKVAVQADARGLFFLVELEGTASGQKEIRYDWVWRGACLQKIACWRTVNVFSRDDVVEVRSRT